MTEQVDLGIDGLSDFREIGSGGFAVVYSALEEEVGRRVAVKVLATIDEGGRRRFDRERRTMGQTTDHPNIVTLFRSGYTSPGDKPFLVMEHLAGGSLQDRLEATGPIPWHEAIALVVPVADALGYSHRSGILHKDVKPANILVSSTGVVKLSDFGIAAVRESTATSQVAFSMLYTSPESFDAHRDDETGRVVDPRDERSDLYSLAATLYALGTGQAPFHSTTPASLMRQILTEPVAPTGHERLDAFFARAMAKDPADRHHDAAGFAAELAVLVTSTPATSAPVASTPVASVPVASVPVASVPVASTPTASGQANWAPPVSPPPRLNLDDNSDTVVRADRRPSVGSSRLLLAAALGSATVLFAAAVVVGVRALAGNETADAPAETTSEPATGADGGTSGSPVGGDDGDGASEPASTSAAGGEPRVSGETIEAAPSCPGRSDGVLRFGTVLSETGLLDFLGPAQRAGAELAVAEINENGGVLGQPVVLTQGDSGDTSSGIADQTVEAHLSAGVDVFIGATSSSSTLTIIEQVVSGCRVLFSPANTSSALTSYADGDLYFRTSPSDSLQGRALADLMTADGVESLAVLALEDPYADAIIAFTVTPFENQGGVVVEEIRYSFDATAFGSEIDAVIAAAPDALLLIGFSEVSTVLATAFDKGLTPDTTRIYLTDSAVGNALGFDFQPGELAGITGVLASAEPNAGFTDRLVGVDPGLVDTLYGPETYDAVVISALAAIAAGSDNPVEIAGRINGVTRDGTVCTSFTECTDLLESGVDIDYDGPSGPQTFGPEGEPSEAFFSVLRYDADNRVDGTVAPEYRLVRLADR